MRWDSNSIKPGMFVMSTSGERIGKVIRCNADDFIVEKGVLFPRDYELRYDHITDDQRRHDLVFAGRLSGIEPASGRACGLGASAASRTGERARGARGDGRDGGGRAASGAREERAGAESYASRSWKKSWASRRSCARAGHVRIHKAVKSEEKRFAVPTTREEVVIEHVPATNGRSAISGEPAFEEETVDVTLHEEELRVSKRPVLREEVVIRTVAQSVETEGSATLRHEEAEIEDTRRTLPTNNSNNNPAAAARATRAPASASEGSAGC